MGKKTVDDYITEGLYGKRRPKEAERKIFLGTLRERIVIALTKGQVMSDHGLKKLEEEMKEHQDAKLLLNGHVSSRFLREEKELADKYNIPYTSITNEDSETDIGAVLTYDYAINKENIFIEDEENEEETAESNSFLSKLKDIFL
ncbi:YueI family protein [Virgibacillus kimchii]